MTKALGWGILGAVALAALLYLAGLIGPETGPLSLVAPVETASVEETSEDGAAPALASSAPAAPEAPDALAAPAEPAESAATPDEAVADAPAEAPAEPAPPRFDLVRADPGGQTLVAGSAAPGAQVSVLLDGEAQPVASADSSGRFAMFLDLPPSADPRVLRLSMKLDGQEIASSEEVILAPPPPSETPEPPAAGDAAEAGSVASATASETDAAPVPVPAADATAALAAAEPETAPAVLLSTEAGVEVLQGGEALPEGQVAIDAITYDETGGVTLSGRGSSAAGLRIYLDNRAVASAEVPESGRWQVDLPEVAGGTYTLRVDQLSEAGAVTARAESPFLREEPAKLAAAADDADAGEAALTAVTVQPGHTLWALARDRYGEGLAYVKVFEANRDQIRNPDLIYPGQIFDLPE
ncbi:LysM peptidoglycan-binding domain-containing protein [Salipiger bermudensis]|uniref:LysM peptidoglycan-binding domain-containing protein n=1 Tax=Salipiger bermudensis TaxID=344736 RepID=UPI001C991246|nr:LysM peptidoglycan-binding domain-containing protein [Salipiger bermudensis]MBY6004418.1 LysM peptidoglycan-binding domain-containing protein [Salipiger bermudensis]